MQTGFQRWVVNLACFVLLSLLAVTGLIGWILPHGPGAGAQSLRHFLHDVHLVTAVLFAAAIGVHLMLHWGYIEQNLKKYGLLKR